MSDSRAYVQRERHAVAVLAVAMATLAVGGLLGGCGFDLEYVIRAAAGQVEVLRDSVPLTRAIESGDLTEEQVSKLELIRDVRQYANEVIGLSVDGNYTRFYDSTGDPVAYNVSACRKDAFEPRVWTFPIVGTLPYLGFFSRSAADAKAVELEGEGYDVLLYEVDAYSGLDFFPSTVLSPMLERSELSLTDTVFHELLHSTIWRSGDVSFNESLATFVGRRGALEYLADRFPDEPERIQHAVKTFADTDRYSDFALTLFNELDDFYSSGLSSADKIAGRGAVYQAGRDRFVAEVGPLMNCPECYNWVASLPTNNAYMMSVRRYNLDLNVFEEVFEAAGRDWATSLQLFRDAAAAADPYSYLRTWLEATGDGSARVSGTIAARAKQTRVDPSAGAQPIRRVWCTAHRATTIYMVE